MRFVFFILSFLLAVSAAAQINTKQIKWPQPSCNTSGAPYNPKDDICTTTTTTGGLPVANPQYSGTMQGPTAIVNTMTASVNSQINVMAPPYNAKGDCVTDDHNAIMSAFAAAAAATASNATPPTVYFPAPPGGCYLTSTLEYNGVPLLGQPSQTGLFQGAATLKGKPSQDILHISDPSLVANNLYGSMWIKDLNFLVDDSTDASASHPHRLVGRAVDDAAMTSGSATITTKNASIRCGDQGQQIQVNGAGASGANLVTTIASIANCWEPAGWPSGNFPNAVTLAAAASTTVSNAHAIIGINGYAPTQSVGNGAIAYDNSDGNQANWLTAIHTTNNSSYGLLENVNITSISGARQNNTVGIWMQGYRNQYGLKVENVNVQRFIWGIVLVCNDVNSGSGACNQDLQTWEHMHIEAINPIIVYDGMWDSWHSIQLYNTNGADFLSLQNAAEYGPLHLSFRQVESEGPGGGGYGWRITSDGAILNTIAPLSQTGQTAYLDGSSIICTNCQWTNLALNGVNNQVTSEVAQGGGVTYGGHNGVVNGGKAGNYKGAEASVPYSFLINRGPGYVSGQIDGSALEDGNGALVRNQGYNRGDLQMFPDDAMIDQTTAFQDVVDTASPTGKAILFAGNTGGFLGLFTHMYYGSTQSGGLWSFGPGGLIPQTTGTWYAYVACNGTGSTQLFMQDTNGSISGGYMAQMPNLACTGPSSTYVLQTSRVNLAAFAPGNMQFINYGTSPIKVAYMEYVPDVATVNGNPLSNFADLPGSVTTTAATSDAVTLTGASSTSTCSLTATNAAAATNIATTYISAKAANTITITHAATAGMTYDLLCTRSTSAAQAFVSVVPLSLRKKKVIVIVRPKRDKELKR